MRQSLAGQRVERLPAVGARPMRVRQMKVATAAILEITIEERSIAVEHSITTEIAMDY